MAWRDNEVGFEIPYVRAYVADLRSCIAFCGCLVLLFFIVVALVGFTLLKLIPSVALLALIGGIAFLFLIRRR